MVIFKFTHPKFNIAPEKLPSQKEKIVFQPPFSGAMLNFGGVRFWTEKLAENKWVMGGVFHPYISGVMGPYL